MSFQPSRLSGSKLLRVTRPNIRGRKSFRQVVKAARQLLKERNRMIKVMQTAAPSKAKRLAR
jgi:hypothetical protein